MNGLPGDVVEVQKLYQKKRSFFGEISNIIIPSTLRKKKLCLVSGVCGACDWVNIDYIEQLKLKSQIYQEIFSRWHTVLDDLINESPVINYYRNKCFFSVQKKEGKHLLGMYTRNTHDVIEHEHCYLYPPLFKLITDTVREWILEGNVELYDECRKQGSLRSIGFRQSSDGKSIILILVTKNSRLPFTNLLIKRLVIFPEITGIIQNIQSEPHNVILGQRDKILFGSPELLEQITIEAPDHTKKVLNLRVHYSSFFQVNSLQALNIYTDIYRYIEHDETVLDVYSGMGMIGLWIALKAQKVICIEENAKAVQTGITNAKENNLENLEFLQGDVKTVFNNLDLSLIDTVIFDPPRKGLESSVILQVCKQRIRKIIYLSCNPATQKRDLELFLAEGYQLISLRGYDMFPHTWHIESLAVLELKY